MTGSVHIPGPRTANGMRLGVVLPRPADWYGTLRLGPFLAALQGLGYSYVRLLDHVAGADSRRHTLAGPYDGEDPFYETFTAASYIAACSGLDISTGVLVLPQRQTVLVAKQAAEIDRFTQGRLRLGVGLGWNSYEYEALSTEFAGRASRLEEQVAVLRLLWTEPYVSFLGSYHELDRVGINPLPRQRPIPIWLGTGTAESSLRRVARIADGWIPSPSVPLDDLAASLDTIARLAAGYGRGPNDIGLEGRIDVSDSTSSHVAREAQVWSELSASHLAIKTFDLSSNGFSKGVRPLEEHLEILAAVADAVRHCYSNATP